MTVSLDLFRSRFTVRGPDGTDAELVFARDDPFLYLLHTEVPTALRGTGVGSDLVRAAADLARDNGLTVVPWCPFARRWLRAHAGVAASISIDWRLRPPERMLS